MSRKTKARRSTPSLHVSSLRVRHCSVSDAPRVEQPLPLVCGACGASGRYNVGTVTLDPTVAKAPIRSTWKKRWDSPGIFGAETVTLVDRGSFRLKR